MVKSVENLEFSIVQVEDTFLVIRDRGVFCGSKVEYEVLGEGSTRGEALINSVSCLVSVCKERIEADPLIYDQESGSYCRGIYL